MEGKGHKTGDYRKQGRTVKDLWKDDEKGKGGKGRAERQREV